mgnify:CR=1 FL=1
MKPLLALLMLGLLASCNTFEGMGRDVQSLGNWIVGDSDDGRQPVNPSYPQQPYY